MHFFKKFVGINCCARSQTNRAFLKNETERELIDLDVVNVVKEPVFGIGAARSAKNCLLMIAKTLPCANQTFCLIPPKTSDDNICTHD